MQQYVVGNWKMNGTREEALRLATGFAKKILGVDHPLPRIILCPSYPYLDPVHQAIENTPLILGAQNCHGATSGAFTGEVSCQQLVDVGAKYVILGHSERRQGHFETDAVVREKLDAALHHHLHAILCVGESKADRDAGHALKTVLTQVKNAMPLDPKPELILVAYEPLWAIGTGVTPTLDQIKEMHGAIRQELSKLMVGGNLVPILYGGSVNAQNAREILAIPHVNGVLVGGASLKLEEFWSIINASRE